MGESFKVRFVPSPSINPLNQLPERTLILHATEGPHVAAAIGTFTTKKVKGDDRSGLSIHLVLGKDGRDVVQMLSFEKGANHAADYNRKSVGIELDYPGDLRESDSASEFKKLSKYSPDQYIYASALNDSKFKYWPLYPREQLDALVTICKTLINTYQITDVAGHEELYSYKMDPGPAFPIIQFRERLRVKGRSVVLQETARKVRVRNIPGDQFAFLSAPEIPEGKPVTIINEYTDQRQKPYCLISVIASVEGNPWIIGWVERDAVRVKANQVFAVSSDHYLTTQDGRRFQTIAPHQNGFNRIKLLTDRKYIIIHFTTGTRIESTIAYFRNESSEVSAHLLISSDGRVIQFLPFNRIAFHAGDSWWEGDKNLNGLSIGIELDNAGFLTKRDNGWFRKDIRIPDEDVVIKTHDREFNPRGWEKFSKIQMDVLEKVVRAIMEQYGGPDNMEMIGHDDVNIANRLDPGPDFPMKRIRKKVFGRRDAKYEVFTLDKNASMYENVGGGLPNIKHRKHDADLSENSTVTLIREASGWSLIFVNQSSKSVLRKSTGWVRSRSLEPLGIKGRKEIDRKGRKNPKNKEKNIEQRMRVKVNTAYYRKAESPPSPLLPKRDLKKNPKIRIQEVRDNWALIVLLKLKGTVDGWVEKKFISPPPPEK